MRSKYDEQLKLLNEELTEMGILVEKAITCAIEALGDDKEKAREAISYDAEIDRMEKDIENVCLKLILRQQPIAADLRQISAALKMITDMERIGDMASDISEIAMIKKNKGNPEHIFKMAKAAVKMVRDSVDAFVKKDGTLAKKVISDDDGVDKLFTEVKDDLIAEIRSDTEDATAIVDFLMIAKYLERIGDHATNIAEWVLFSITGEHE